MRGFCGTSHCPRYIIQQHRILLGHVMWVFPPLRIRFGQLLLAMNELYLDDWMSAY